MPPARQTSTEKTSALKMSQSAAVKNTCIASACAENACFSIHMLIITIIFTQACNASMQMQVCKCDTVLNHTGLYEYRHGKMLMHLRFTFESLNTLNSPGEYVRYYRQLRGLTTRQLAEKLNIVPATVLAYEQERFPIPYEISIAAAETLHISEELLFDDFCIFISAPYTEILHTVRKRYGLNQVDFAQKAGISPSIYAKWEAGNRRPSRKMYQQLKAIYPEI